MQIRTLCLFTSVVAAPACVFDPTVAPEPAEETDTEATSGGPLDTGGPSSAPVDGTDTNGQTSSATGTSTTSGTSDGADEAGLESTSSSGGTTDEGGSSSTGGCPTGVFGQTVFGESCFG